jgi:hypothetical protein
MIGCPETSDTWPATCILLCFEYPDLPIADSSGPGIASAISIASSKALSTMSNERITPSKFCAGTCVPSGSNGEPSNRRACCVDAQPILCCQRSCKRDVRYTRRDGTGRAGRQAGRQAGVAPAQRCPGSMSPGPYALTRVCPPSPSRVSALPSAQCASGRCRSTDHGR